MPQPPPNDMNPPQELNALVADLEARIQTAYEIGDKIAATFDADAAQGRAAAIRAVEPLQAEIDALYAELDRLADLEGAEVAREMSG